MYFLIQLKRANVARHELILFYTSCIRSVMTYASPAFFYALPLYVKKDLGNVEKRALSIICSGLAYRKALELSNIMSINDYIASLCKKTFLSIANDPAHRLAEAQEYFQKALNIKRAIGDKHGEVSCYLSLGNMFQSVGEYAKAEEYLQKALTTKTEIGDNHGEASRYINIGNVFQSVGEYAKAEEYLQKALTINTEIGDKNGEAKCYGNLGIMFHSVGEYAKAEEYLQKALTITTETGGRDGEASCYTTLGIVFLSVGE